MKIKIRHIHFMSSSWYDNPFFNRQSSAIGTWSRSTECHPPCLLNNTGPKKCCGIAAIEGGPGKMHWCSAILDDNFSYIRILCSQRQIDNYSCTTPDPRIIAASLRRVVAFIILQLRQISRCRHLVPQCHRSTWINQPQKHNMAANFPSWSCHPTAIMCARHCRHSDTVLGLLNCTFLPLLGYHHTNLPSLLLLNHHGLSFQIKIPSVTGKVLNFPYNSCVRKRNPSKLCLNLLKLRQLL